MHARRVIRWQSTSSSSRVPVRAREPVTFDPTAAAAAAAAAAAVAVAAAVVVVVVVVVVPAAAAAASRAAVASAGSFAIAQMEHRGNEWSSASDGGRARSRSCAHDDVAIQWSVSGTALQT